MMLEQFNPLFLSLFSFFFVNFFLYKYWLSKKKETPRNQPPSPPNFPIIGNLHQLGRYPHISLRSLAKKYGQLMLLHFGSVPVLVVSSADAAREIMKTHDLVFSGRPKSSVSSRIFYDGKDVAFAPYSEYWRQVKSISVLQLLSNRRVHSFQKVREEEVALLIEKIKHSHSKTVNLSVLFGALANNIVCRIVLGKKYEGPEGNLFKELLVEMSEMLGSFCVGDYIPWLYWVDMLNGLKGRVEKTAKGLDDFIEGVLRDYNNSASENGSGNRYLVSVLMEIQKQNTSSGFSLDKDSVKGVIFDLFAAGTDTISTVLEWSMAELIKNPEILKKLQNEVREVGRGKSGIWEDDLDKMHYLKAVIKESLRINIPVPLLVPREARDNVNVMGYDIKKGTRVLVNVWAIARDPSLWENPEEFRPERFLNSPIDYKGLHFEFLPFGAGRRGCPGIQFGMVVNELALANVVHMFDFALPDEKRLEDLDMASAAGLTVHKKYPLLVIATSCI